MKGSSPAATEKLRLGVQMQTREADNCAAHLDSQQGGFLQGRGHTAFLGGQETTRNFGLSQFKMPFFALTTILSS